MSLVRLTASGLRRTALCPAWVSLPHSEERHDDADAGTAEHATLEAATPEGERSEVALAFNVLTGEGRELPAQAHRAYPDLGPGWIYGTVDRLRVDPTRVVVTDWKTGGGAAAGHFSTQPIEENLQMEFGAVASCAAYGRSEAMLVIAYTASEETAERSMDALDLLAAESTLRNIYGRATAPNPQPVESTEACWRCPAAAACPLKRARALEVVESVRETSAGVVRAELPGMPTLDLTVESVAAGWTRLRQVREAVNAVLGEVERAYRGFAATTPVPLPNGKTLSEVEKSRESLDGSVVFRVLEQTHGREVALAAVELDATKASIERAVKPIAPKGKGAALVRETLERIRAEGGTTTKTTRSVEEHT